MPHNETDILPHTNDLLPLLAAEVERLTKLNDAYKRRNVSGCVCQISEDGETVEKWCDLHFAVRAERDQLIRAIADHVTARGLLLEAKEKAEAERDALRERVAVLESAVDSVRIEKGAFGTHYVVVGNFDRLRAAQAKEGE